MYYLLNSSSFIALYTTIDGLIVFPMYIFAVHTVAETYLIKSVSVSHWAQRFQLDHGGGAPHCGVAWVVSGAISRTSTITSGVLGYTME